MAPLRIVFMGTPDLAVTSLEALLRAPSLQVVAVVTQSDRPKGRGLKLRPPPVKDTALRENLPVLQPERLRDESALRELSGFKPDLIAVVAYGQILPKSVLDLPIFGCLNVHTSLLPKYRGAAPVQWALLNGETETGVTIMKLGPGLDTGDLLAQKRTPIHPSDNSETLHERLGRLGAELLVQTIPEYVAGRLTPRPQPDEGVSHAPKIKKSDGQISWKQPAQAIRNRVRALAPWPGAFTRLPGSSRPQLLKIREADVSERSGPPGEILEVEPDGIVVGCGAESLRILALQLEGGRCLSAQEFLAGHSLSVGQNLG